MEEDHRGILDPYHFDALVFLTANARSIHQANKLLSDRDNPDYENSIKESISAVEAICEIITDAKGK